MSEIKLDLSSPDSDALKNLKPGDRWCLSYACGTVTTNDGKTLSGGVDEIEVKEDETGPADEVGGDKSGDQGGEEEPAEGNSMAMQAMAMGKKKM